MRGWCESRWTFDGFRPRTDIAREEVPAYRFFIRSHFIYHLPVFGVVSLSREENVRACVKVDRPNAGSHLAVGRAWNQPFRPSRFENSEPKVIPTNPLQSRTNGNNFRLTKPLTITGRVEDEVSVRRGFCGELGTYSQTKSHPRQMSAKHLRTMIKESEPAGLKSATFQSDRSPFIEHFYN